MPDERKISLVGYSSDPACDECDTASRGLRVVDGLYLCYECERRTF